MIHSLEHKTKRELAEIVKIQLEEYQLLQKRNAELESVLQKLHSLGGLGYGKHKWIEDALKGSK